MKMEVRKHATDLTVGSMLKSMFFFAIPVSASNCLQMFFNSVDVMVVGRFAGADALAAVGATSLPINFLVSLFTGLATGGTVVIARLIGCRAGERIRRAVHSSVLLGIVSGVIMAIAGICFAKKVLLLLNTPEEVINAAVLYLRIYFGGMPIIMAFNFCAGILRAAGDTRKPLRYLTIAGVINFGCNVLFVAVFHWGVAGVAIATVFSQTIALIMIFHELICREDEIRVFPGKIRFSSEETLAIIQIGIPSSLHSCLYPLSGCLIQNAVNSLGMEMLIANTAAANLDGFLNHLTSGFNQAVMTFTSQNYGAGKRERVKQGIWYGIIGAVITDVVIGCGMVLFGHPLLGLFKITGELADYGMIRLKYVARLYFLAGIMDPVVYALRGLGKSAAPMAVSVFTILGFRIIYFYTVFQKIHTPEALYLTFPITWLISIILDVGLLIYYFHKTMPKTIERRST